MQADVLSPLYTVIKTTTHDNSDYIPIFPLD